MIVLPTPILYASENKTITQRAFSPRIRLRSYAFVEFRSQRDAEDAYYDMYVLIPPLNRAFIVDLSTLLGLGMAGISTERGSVSK